ncbi:hypothetical protein N6H18_00490 [Reichenbachiella agarivorans]|uniref:Uncharacterized protein n=1 Tax=Reichenbachiella agarivorans TaxID=2979464 RepID=A0ABY6CSM8_9BACT|nr:hypothetical protein [Reichenbachiella agarivorans]UXP32453.1 hypothetical protein N6H18_00490 [Reichenbachiella agarivorans]
MRILVLGGVLVLMLVVGDAFGQTSRDSEAKTSSKEAQFSQNKHGAKKVFRQKEDQALKDYEILMKQNKKKYKKQAKEMEKPQYSDPSYFGHKKPPKKRPLGKRKMCKECGIVH